MKAIESGYPQKAVAEEAYRVAKEEEKGQKVVVGVNKFVTEEPEKKRLVLHKSDHRSFKTQVQRTEEVKKSRSQSGENKALDHLCRPAEGKENLMPFFVEAVKT